MKELGVRCQYCNWSDLDMSVSSLNDSFGNVIHYYHFRCKKCNKIFVEKIQESFSTTITVSADNQAEIFLARAEEKLREIRRKENTKDWTRRREMQNSSTPRFTPLEDDGDDPGE